MNCSLTLDPLTSQYSEDLDIPSHTAEGGVSWSHCSDNSKIPTYASEMGDQFMARLWNLECSDIVNSGSQGNGWNKLSAEILGISDSSGCVSIRPTGLQSPFLVEKLI